MILRKCTAAHKLVSSYQATIRAGRADSSYPEWSDHFLTFCEQTADKTLKFLGRQFEKYSEGTISEEDFSSLLSTIMQSWELLHAFMKPVLDADTLKVPYPLVDFITHHVGCLNIVRGVKFIVETSSGLTYYHREHSSLQPTMSELRLLVNAPEVEPLLGFLGLPCSQNKSLFMNCLLFHEAGHFIAEEAGILSVHEFDGMIDALNSSFGSSSRWAAETIAAWIEELFADLVAVNLLGAAYTFAYMELLRQVADLSSEYVGAFGSTHPADALRLREQLLILRKDKWSPHCRALSQWKELNQIAQLGPDDYSPPTQHTENPAMADVAERYRKLIDFLCNGDMIQSIRDRVNYLLGDRKNPREDYAESKKAVIECLEHGIVPSRDVDGKSPHPLAIINGAVLFWLSGMNNLYKRVRKLSSEKYTDRAFLEQRLEMWCLKAIEDWLRRQEPDEESSA